MARGRVDRLRVTRHRSAAVVRRAQVRAALDDLAENPDVAGGAHERLAFAVGHRRAVDSEAINRDAMDRRLFRIVVRAHAERAAGHKTHPVQSLFCTVANRRACERRHDAMPLQPRAMTNDARNFCSHQCKTAGRWYSSTAPLNIYRAGKPMRREFRRAHLQ